ncbi:related to GPI-anchor transamidase GAA1 [Rhynchosporium agropyri]|uniref:Related to GPI-anchor transamidase GAA1 n=1 Tax=Rhynchosporium agropyri TaxID=914238 RepID=A0A1E1KS69_9HELO|nr:related to GPI-anchor transamidase GAA1 [Rhynchosporium agropyri]
MAPSLPQFSAVRFRSYIFRLPLCTRGIILVIGLFWVAGMQSVWDVQKWGALTPKEVGLSSSLYPSLPAEYLLSIRRAWLMRCFCLVYRTNTFPLIHAGFFHAFMNILALTPLLERFEAEHGTLTTLALFTGPLSTIPALLYTFVERGVLRMNTTILGASIWVFTLVAMEAVKTYKSNPYFMLGTTQIPTWITPFVMVLFVSVLVPNTSFLGHICGLAFGYGWGLGYLKFLAPPERALRWIEGKLNLLGRLPHYVSVDQKTYGRYGNALLPGQVHTYFAGSDQNVFRGYKHEVDALEGESNIEVNDKLEEFFKASGLKVARQKYEYKSAGETYSGENIYAILHAPRGDATEAIVLVGAWRNVEEELNRSGVALVLTLARYFKRWSLWSKDIIFLVTADSTAGPQAWVDAYHDTHQSPAIESLPLKSGALQGAVVIDYPFDHRFESIHVVYDGTNGQLPNLDLLNTVVSIASGQMGIGVSIQKMWKHADNYQDRLQTMLRGMLKQGLGYASGPHSSFIPYHVDAITLQPFGAGWQDEMAMGRVIESTFRSLNNLLEHLHQSFFFYLLMQSSRFVSIGTYLPSAMLVAVNFTIMAIFLWIKSGSPKSPAKKAAEKGEKKQLALVQEGGVMALVPEEIVTVRERELFLPLAVVAGVQFLGVVPLFIFNHTPQYLLEPVFIFTILLNFLLPPLLSTTLTTYFAPTSQQYTLIKAFSLLLLGLFLSALATLNFSLAFLVGLFSAPLTYIQPLPSHPIIAYILAGLLMLSSPTTVVLAGSWHWGMGVGQVLKEAAFGWDVWGMNTQVVVWCVWWPAWFLGMMLLFGKPRVEEDVDEDKKEVERL